MAQQEKPQAPQHIGIIMDGNGRWAKKRMLPRSAGHVQGAKTLRTIAEYARDRGVKYLTVYAFSTENWSRPKEEVDSLMDLLRKYLRDMLKEPTNHVNTRFIGDKTAFSPEIRELIDKVENLIDPEAKMVLQVALNYGGRDELVKSVRRIAQRVQQGQLSWDAIDEQTISDELYTASVPDPDLIIRPSGEYRTSNFLLWQSAYSEYVFMDGLLWPDFKPSDLDAAIEEYAGRNRRFGGI